MAIEDERFAAAQAQAARMRPSAGFLLGPMEFAPKHWLDLAVSDLNGPNNPLNHPEDRKILEADRRLTPDQQEAIRNYDKNPLTVDQQLSILKSLDMPSGGYGGGKRLSETLLERIEREAREKGQNLTAPREQDREHDRGDDLER